MMVAASSALWGCRPLMASEPSNLLHPLFVTSHHVLGMRYVLSPLVQALLTILDSPLNKAGKVKGIYIHTVKNVLIQASGSSICSSSTCSSSSNISSRGRMSCCCCSSTLLCQQQLQQLRGCQMCRKSRVHHSRVQLERGRGVAGGAVLCI